MNGAEIIGNALKLSRLRVEQAQLVASFASLTIAAGAFVTGSMTCHFYAPIFI